MSLLTLQGVSLSFAGSRVLDGVNYDVPPRQIVSLSGPTGAGKTPLLTGITGLYTPKQGSVRIDGPETLRLKPHQVTRLGIARTFQNVRLFRSMSVLENVMSGMHCRTSAGIVDAILRLPSQRREEAEIKAFAEGCLSFVGITEGWDRDASTLPYGWQRRVEIARALASRPRLLLLDEPAAGLTSGEKQDLIELIRRIRGERDICVLLIEHDIELVMSLSERVSVLDHGTMIAEGTPKEIQANPRVIEAYLGVEEDSLGL